MKLVEIVYAEKFKGYKNRRSHLRGMKFLCQKIRGVKFFRTKIRGAKILVDLQKYTPTGYPGLEKTTPFLTIDSSNGKKYTLLQL